MPSSQLQPVTAITFITNFQQVAAARDYNCYQPLASLCRYSRHRLATKFLGSPSKRSATSARLTQSCYGLIEYWFVRGKTGHVARYGNPWGVIRWGFESPIRQITSLTLTGSRTYIACRSWNAAFLHDVLVATEPVRTLQGPKCSPKAAKKS